MKDYKSFINKLDSNKICIYLQHHGWRDIGSLMESKLKLFDKDNCDSTIIIPMEKSFTDYYRVYIDSLNVLAESESSTLISLLNRLINPSCDLLKWRIEADDTFLGSISLESMGNNIEHIKDLLASSCLDILNPSVYHKKVLTKDVVKQINQYKFGQTEVGSYILNLLCPLGYYQYELFDLRSEDLPMSRRINVKLLQDIQRIQKSINDNSTELTDDVQSEKISVNFLNALSGMYEDNKESDISLCAEWSNEVPNIEDNIIPSVKLDTRCMDKVVEVAEANTPKEQQNIQKTFFGKIKDIGGDEELNNRSDITIKIVAIGDEGKKITVQAQLPFVSCYSIVDEAFENANTVKVTGTLTKVGYINKLSQASIEIVSDDNDQR